MKTVAKLSNGYVIDVSNNIPYLYRNGVHIVCSPIVLQEIIKMRELLQAVHDHVGIDSSLSEKAWQAIDNIDQYILNLPK